MRKIMACLDVGSDTVKCVVGEIVKRKLNVLAVAETPSKGVKYGIVEDPNSVLDSLKNVIQKCEEIIGNPEDVGGLTSLFTLALTEVIDVTMKLVPFVKS